MFTIPVDLSWTTLVLRTSEVLLITEACPQIREQLEKPSFFYARPGHECLWGQASFSLSL